MTAVIDSHGIAHTRSTCSEFHGPAIGSAPGRLFVTCADCEAPTTERDYAGLAWAICSAAALILVCIWWAESLAVGR